MNRYYYDLHIHSCLSPCADNDMTPHNIAGMAALAGLQIIALTDHNSTRNCRPFYAACRKQGLVPIAGMELTTAEDIHIICLFESLETAEAFEAAMADRKIPYQNKKEIFGDQLLMDEQDEVIGEEEYLLSKIGIPTFSSIFLIAALKQGCDINSFSAALVKLFSL